MAVAGFADALPANLPTYRPKRLPILCPHHTSQAANNLALHLAWIRFALVHTLMRRRTSYGRGNLLSTRSALRVSKSSVDEVESGLHTP